METRIEIETPQGWNDNRLTLVEQPSGMGDRVMVCIHTEHVSPEEGYTVKVLKSQLIRAAKMLGTPYESADTE